MRPVKIWEWIKDWGNGTITTEFTEYTENKPQISLWTLLLALSSSKGAPWCNPQASA